MTDTRPASEMPIDPDADWPELAPPPTKYLRQRVRALDPAQLDALFASWVRRGLPDLANEDGTDAVIPAEAVRDIDALVAAYEPKVTDSTWDLLQEEAALVTAYFDVYMAAQDQGVVNYRSRLHMTEGRALMVLDIIDDVERLLADRDEPLVDEVLAPIPDGPVGQLVSDQLDEGQLDLAPPTGKVADVLAWVEGRPDRARAALDAEQERKKPRSSLVSKLQPLAGPVRRPLPTAADYLPEAPVQATLADEVEVQGDAEAPDNVTPMTDKVAEFLRTEAVEKVGQAKTIADAAALLDEVVEGLTPVVERLAELRRLLGEAS